MEDKFKKMQEEVEKWRKEYMKDPVFADLIKGVTMAEIRYQLALQREDPEAAKWHKKIHDELGDAIQEYLKAKTEGIIKEEDYKIINDLLETLKKNGYWYELE